VTSWSCSCSWLGRGLEGASRGEVGGGGCGPTAALRCRRRPGCAPGGRVQVAPRIAAPASGEHRRPPTVSGRVMDRRPAPVSRRAGRGRFGPPLWMHERPRTVGYGPDRTQIRAAPKAQPPGTACRNLCNRRGSRSGICNCYATHSTAGPALRTSTYAGFRAARTRPISRRFSGNAGGLAGCPAGRGGEERHRRRARRGLGRGVVAGSRRRCGGTGRPGGNWPPVRGPPGRSVTWFGGRAVPGACRAGCVAWDRPRPRGRCG